MRAGKGWHTCSQMPGPILAVSRVQGPLITNTVSWLSVPAELALTCPCSLLLRCLLPKPRSFFGEEAFLWGRDRCRGTPIGLLFPPNPLTLSLLLPCCLARDLQCVRGLKDLLRTAALFLSRSGLGGAKHQAPPPA